MTWRDEDVWGLEEEILEEYYMKYNEVGGILYEIQRSRPSYNFTDITNNFTNVFGFLRAARVPYVREWFTACVRSLINKNCNMCECFIPRRTAERWALSKQRMSSDN